MSKVRRETSTDTPVLKKQKLEYDELKQSEKDVQKKIANHPYQAYLNQQVVQRLAKVMFDSLEDLEEGPEMAYDESTILPKLVDSLTKIKKLTYTTNEYDYYVSHDISYLAPDLVEASQGHGAEARESDNTMSRKKQIIVEDDNVINTSLLARMWKEQLIGESDISEFLTNF